MGVCLVGVLAAHTFLKLLGSALKADFEGLLSALVGLTSHGGLVDEQLAALDEETVDGDDITILKADNVANVQVVEVEFFLRNFAVRAGAGDENLKIQMCEQKRNKRNGLWLSRPKSKKSLPSCCLRRLGSA